jgi:hypothetical protein
MSAHPTDELESAPPQNIVLNIDDKGEFDHVEDDEIETKKPAAFIVDNYRNSTIYLSRQPSSSSERQWLFALELVSAQWAMGISTRCLVTSLLCPVSSGRWDTRMQRGSGCLTRSMLLLGEVSRRPCTETDVQVSMQLLSSVSFWSALTRLIDSAGNQC